MHVRDMYFQTWRKVEGQDTPVDTILFVPNLMTVTVYPEGVQVVTKSGAIFEVVKDRFSERLAAVVKEYNESISVEDVEGSSSVDSSAE